MDHRVELAIDRIASAQGIEGRAVLALLLVESEARPFWLVDGEEKPPIRFEGHKFFAQLEGASRNRAVRQGLASSKAGMVKNPSTYAARYALLERAAEIDRPAAYAATSWGMGQVMGFHWRALGYRSVLELAAAAGTIEGQVDMVVRYLRMAGLVGAMNAHDWKAVARGYNGPAFARNRYDAKLAERYAQLEKGAPTVTFQGTRTSSRPEVRIVQERLARLGYEVEVDGIKGPQTEAAVRAFQMDQGLVVDGDAGQLTVEALEREVAALEAEKAAIRKKTATVTGTAVGGVLGGGLIGTMLEKGPDLLTGLGGLPWQVGVTGVVVAGGLGIAWIYRPRRRRAAS